MSDTLNRRRIRNFDGLLKLAYFGQTVGDVMTAWNSDFSANHSIRRDAFDRINRSGIDVKQPASRLLHIVGGGLAGNALSKYLGARPFWSSAATIGGAIIGNNMYNKKYPNVLNQKIAPGVIRRGF